MKTIRYEDDGIYIRADGDSVWVRIVHYHQPSRVRSFPSFTELVGDGEHCFEEDGGRKLCRQAEPGGIRDSSEKMGSKSRTMEKRK